MAGLNGIPLVSQRDSVSACIAVIDLKRGLFSQGILLSFLTDIIANLEITAFVLQLLANQKGRLFS